MNAFALLNLYRMDEEDNNEKTSVDVIETLRLQLAEMEMLQSMFPNNSELKMDDTLAAVHIQAFLDGNTSYEYLYTRFGFTLKIAPENCKIKAELVCQLPHEYPSQRPVVFTRSPNMNRSNHQRLNDDLHEFLLSTEKDEMCILSVIEWIQENLVIYQEAENLNQSTNKVKVEDDTVFTRLWIYSHHIYSKFKRRDIIDWAQELKLTGFSLPGKPGVVCVEGFSKSVDDYWYRLRRQNWKRLMIKEKDSLDIIDGDITKHRMFSDFEEKVFDARGGKGREYHMDLGKLYEFLNDHGCGHIFQSYFGVEGKTGVS